MLLQLVCFSSVVKSQNERLILLVYNSDSTVLLKSKSVSDSVGVDLVLSKIQNKDLDIGYIHAGYDSVKYASSGVSAFYNRGEQYSWGKFEVLGLDSVADFSLGKNKRFLDKPPSLFIMKSVMDNIVHEFENLGYPLCEVETVIFKTKDSLVNWTIKINAGVQFRLDSVIINSEISFPRKYVMSKLGVNPGDLYNRNRFSQFEKNSKDLGFVKLKSPAAFDFSQDNFSLVLSYEKERNNKFSGMIGIVPGNETENLYLTGEANVFLQNAFHQAETISVKWKSFERESQNLNLQYIHPVIVGPWGVVGDFSLNKQDTTYVNVEFHGGVNRIQSDSEFRFFYEWNGTSLVETSDDQDEFSDSKHNLFGFAYKYQNLDYYKNPRKGVSLYFSTAAGGRKISNTEKANVIANAKVNFSCFIPLTSYSSVNWGVKSAYKYVDDNLNLNEMYRIGGINTIRGYNELSIITPAYCISSLDLMLYPDKESVVFLFMDLGRRQTVRNLIERDSWLFSTGIGIRLNTDIGNVGVYYAIPRTDLSNFDVRQSKIHIGYENNF